MVSLSLFLPIFATLATLFLGGFVLFNNIKNKINKVFSMFALWAAFWVFSVMMADFSKSLESALFWTRMSIVGPAIFSPLLVYFSYIFPSEREKIVFQKIILLFFPVLIFLIFAPTELNVKEISLEEWGTDFTPGILYYLLIVYIFFYFSLAFVNFLKSFRFFSGIKRNQVRYVFFGFFFGVIIGIITNAALPLLGHAQLSSIGPTLSTFGLVGFTAYAISRYRLMDINFVISKGVVYLLSFLLIIIFALLLLFLNDQLAQPLPAHLAVSLILVVSILLFQPIFRFFEKLASKYFYYTFYSYQAVLNNLSRELTRYLNLDRLSSLIVSTLAGTMKLDRAVILTREPESGGYKIEKNVGFKEENGISLVKDNFLTTYLEKNQKPLVYEELSLMIDNASEKEEKEKMEKLKFNMKKIEAALCLPLLMEEKIIGMIVLGNKISGESYSEQDIGLLSNLANQSSIAIQNAKLYQQVEDFSQNLQEKVQEQTRELRKAYQELKVLDKVKSEFISMASHQLRTPLSVIKGYISMIAEDSYGQIPKQAKEKLSDVFQSNERLIKIVNELLNISKIELGKIELFKELTQIEDLIQSCFEEMKTLAEEKNIKFFWQKSKDPLPEIEIDSFKIRQALLNLIDNALKYTKEGEIKIKARKTNSSLQILVKDTGEGLTKKEQMNIFESFTRGKAGISYWVEGAGLGLYVAKKYLELHQGTVWAESQGKGKGSTFYIEMPIKQIN